MTNSEVPNNNLANHSSFLKSAFLIDLDRISENPDVYNEVVDSIDELAEIEISELLEKIHTIDIASISPALSIYFNLRDINIIGEDESKTVIFFDSVFDESKEENEFDTLNKTIFNGLDEDTRLKLIKELYLPLKELETRIVTTPTISQETIISQIEQEDDPEKIVDYVLSNTSSIAYDTYFFQDYMPDRYKDGLYMRDNDDSKYDFTKLARGTFKPDEGKFKLMKTDDESISKIDTRLIFKEYKEYSRNTKNDNSLYRAFSASEPKDYYDIFDRGKLFIGIQKSEDSDQKLEIVITGSISAQGAYTNMKDPARGIRTSLILEVDKDTAKIFLEKQSNNPKVIQELIDKFYNSPSTINAVVDPKALEKINDGTIYGEERFPGLDTNNVT